MFRFTIRDVLWLTVVVAMAVGWWIDRDRTWRQSESSRQVVDRFQKLGVDPEQDLEALRPPPVRVVRIKSGAVRVPVAARTSGAASGVALTLTGRFMRRASKAK